MDRFRRLEPLERVLPEVQLQDVAFSRQHVVTCADAIHRLEMVLNHPSRDVSGELGGLVTAFFHCLEARRAMLETFRIGFVPLGDLGVKIPRNVIEPLAAFAQRGFRVALEHVVQTLAADVPEADDQVGDLDARVVDVVLHLDFPSEPLEETHQGVAEDGVAQMADVGRLVRVDVRVLDDDLALVPRRFRFRAREQGAQENVAIEERVEVTRPRDLDSFDAGGRNDRAGHGAGDVARRLLERASQFETHR